MRQHLVIAVLAALAACGPQAPAPEAATESTAEPAPGAAPLPTDAWLGDWPGVEGTYLKIAAGPSPGQYTLTQGTLDGVHTYQGAAAGERIAFTRTPGAPPEHVRAGTGAETGLKWLADKTDCLVIKDGEGYCR